MRRKLALTILAAATLATPAYAGDGYGPRPLRYGITSPWWTFDARNDDRDIPTNGVFPGNFATHPPLASIGAAGFLESNPYRSPSPYPSQVQFGPPSPQTICARRHRSFDPASGTYAGKDGVRHRC
jgi:hypothetical protein